MQTRRVPKRNKEPNNMSYMAKKHLTLGRRDFDLLHNRECV